MLEWAMVLMSAVLLTVSLVVLWISLRVVAHVEQLGVRGVGAPKPGEKDPVPANHSNVAGDVLARPRVFVPPPDQARLLSREADDAAQRRRDRLNGYTPDRVRMVG